MNDRFSGYDVGFGGGYQAPTASSCIQQQRPSYAANNGPCSDNYDPTRTADRMSAAAAYNSTGIGTSFGAAAAPAHQALLSSRIVGVPAQVAGLGLHNLGDLNALHASKASVRGFNAGAGVAHSNGVMGSGLEQSLGGSAVASFFSTTGTGASPGKARASQPPAEDPDAWLGEMAITVSGLSLEPLNGSEVLSKLKIRTEEVVTRYLPCVDFLVACQQELRKGLAAATTKRLDHHMFRDSMTPRQFHLTYITPLPDRFVRKNKRTMKPDNLAAAAKELQKLCANARAVEHQGCEVVKNTFLGGMKDGESWGLRRWLSKHGGALHICNDCECILHSCQKLDRSLDSTRKLAERLRPLAKKALSLLKSDVPASYQEQSSAHPYLPFFHRLESALRGMSGFDPEDDDVICIDDDDEVEELKAKAKVCPAPKNRPKKRKLPSASQNLKRTAKAAARRPAAAESDDESVIEILDVKPAPRKRPGGAGDNEDAAIMQELLKTFDDDGDSGEFFDAFNESVIFPVMPSQDRRDAFELAEGIDRLAVMFDKNQQAQIRPSCITANSFWDESGHYARALRLFSEILRTPDSSSFLERVDEQSLIENGNPLYSNIIKHPLCFREIVSALLNEPDGVKQLSGSSGQLIPGGLQSWNMWRGNDLLQAIDLVFLNSLAYGKAAEEGRSTNRSKTNKLRKLFWAGIKKVIDTQVGTIDVERRRKCTPTRRGETSGFVVHKGR